jgi:hypothetical protein
MASSNNGQILRYVSKDANNTPTFAMNKFGGEYISKTWMADEQYSQCWSLQLGLRLKF